MLRDWNVPFRALLDAAPDGVVVCDDQGVLVVVNNSAERMFGYAHDELVGKNLESLIPEHLRARHHHHLASYTAEPRLRPMGSHLDLRGRRKDGSELPIEISLSPLTTERGLLVIAAVRDVTERRMLERENRRAMSYLLSAVEAVRDSFLLFDENDRVMTLNSAAREIMGPAGNAPAIGRTFEDLLRASIVDRIYDLGDETAEAFYERRLAYHRAPAGVLELRTQTGRHLRLIERKTADDGTVTMIVDVTDDVHRAAELNQAREQSDAASAAKSEFLSSMSHELRTPLNAILGFAQLLERDRREPLSERQLERLNHVVHGGEHLLHLIDDVLDLSRIEAGRLSVSSEPVDLAEVLGNVVHTLEPMAARAQIQIIAATVLPGTSRVVADRTRLAQILMNFGSNAIKYGRPHGRVAFRIAPSQGLLRVTVVDDGIGIPTDKQGKIFEPFQRAGQEAGPIEGTGIGLAISKRLAEIMRGSVGFNSEPGRGSEFWIELPIDRRPLAELPINRNEAAPGLQLAIGSRRHTIVYVEDNPSNIALMRDIIEEFSSVELLTAPAAELGLELIRTRLPHVVIMDINLPGMSGFEAVKRLRDWPETRDIPVIGLSAAALHRDTVRAKEAGFYRYLTKPVKIDELALVLEQLLEPH
jgi:PAS domain S-box-containing protein